MYLIFFFSTRLFRLHSFQHISFTFRILKLPIAVRPHTFASERASVCAVYFSAAVRLYTVAAACLCFSVGQNTVLQSEPLLSAKCTLGGTKHEKNNNKTNHIIIILLCNVLSLAHNHHQHRHTHTFIQRGTIDIHDVLHECASDRDVSSSRRIAYTHGSHAWWHVDTL